VAFFEWPGVEPLPEKTHGSPVRGPFGFDHVSFGVESEDDLWVLKDRIAAAGLWVSELIDHGFIHSIYAYDPNGIPIEFSHNVEGVNIRRTPAMKDAMPVKYAEEGSEPVQGKWPKVTEPTPKGERPVYPGVGSELYHFLRQQSEKRID
jgi:hypothetical protein